MTHYAHTTTGPQEEWEPLFTPFGDGENQCQRHECQKCADLDPRHGHLNKVAWWTAKFAAEMFPPGPNREAAHQWGNFAGLWHDLGKFHPVFQDKLRGRRVQVEHAGAGALLAKNAGLSNWIVLAFSIAGHHCGLANHLSKVDIGDILTPLDDRLGHADDALRECLSVCDGKLGTAPSSDFPQSIAALADPVKLGAFIRFLFSALVDADSLATEAFCSRSERKTRLRLDRIYDPLSTLLSRLDSHLDAFTQGSTPTPVNAERTRILEWCRNAASLPTGFFQLNVPTGGGKTLSAMAFALRHANCHAGQGMRRVVIAVPYTSIIEQNAGIYQSILGDHNVIEHHSNLDDFAEDEEGGDELTIRRRLACENWDAPVIVTTNVQLFESLFAHKRRRARKLHNLAGSVIVLDEAQCVPVEYLQLILSALRDLVENYGCTIVVSTATQPAWKHRSKFPFGIRSEQLRPIVPPGLDLAKLDAFDRVDIKWPQSWEPTIHDELADLLLAEKCVMAIVHRKKDARYLAKRIRDARPDDHIFHLSTNMCPVHRRQVLEKIRGALVEFRESGIPCRVVSTQLVEAGVDLDFPIIYRALAGLDSIAQAAGRCNREGKLKDRKGKVVVFLAETEPPDGHLKHCAEITRKMLLEYGGELDLRNPSVFEEYFIRLYRDRNLDAKNLMRHAVDLNFETLGREFRLIEDGDQAPVVILFDTEARTRLGNIERIAQHADESVAARFAFRALQPYTVLARPNALKKLTGALQPLFEGSSVVVLDPDFYTGSYDPVFGLSTDDEPQISPDKLIAG